jgi:hypothetical protein
VRRWLLGLGILALVVGSVLGAYVWYRHESGIERAVHAQVRTRHISADWVSCSKDHTVPTGSTTITYYRCDLHGDTWRRDGIVQTSHEVCVPFVGDRVATEAETRFIRLEDVLCDGFS